ncbi:hypothetical protein [Geotalea sp. SG265]|uniref:hypothetical protein n=1 Tax=Geotalea sp. SG265 TaxID=2922867 RepID=UPI001FAEDA0B|nr:hypothetical protein [Geotalea sp. SG265]
MDQATLRNAYPELAFVPFVPVDIVDDGEVLASIGDGAAGFVVANHVIEHCQNPLQTLENWLRAVSRGNILFLTVPEMTMTFDRSRRLTSIDHLIKDYCAGPGWSKAEHFEEIYGANQRGQDEELPISESASHPHYHVWTMASFAETLAVAREDLGLPFVVEEMRRLDAEFAAVLRKTE